MSAGLCAQYSLGPREAGTPVSGCQGHFTLERSKTPLPAEEGRVPANFPPPDSVNRCEQPRINHFRILEDEGGMSTYYYDLKKPWSRIEVDENPESYVIRLWDGQMRQAGVLPLSVEDGREAIYNFFRDEAACQTYVDDQGLVLREFRKVRTNTLLSEYGNVITFGEIKKQCRRRDNGLQKLELGASV